MVRMLGPPQVQPTSSAASSIFSYGLFDIKMGDVDYSRVLAPQARKSAEKAPLPPYHAHQIGTTTSPSAFFFKSLGIGADMVHGFSADNNVMFHHSLILKIDPSTHLYACGDPPYHFGMIGIEPSSMYINPNGIIADEPVYMYHLPPKLGGVAPCPDPHQPDRINLQHIHATGVPYDSGDGATAVEHPSSVVSETSGSAATVAGA